MIKLAKMSISSMFRLNMTVIAVLSSFIMGCFWVFSGYTQYNHDLEILRTEFIESQKELVKGDVAGVVDFIRFNKALAEKRLQQDIRERTYEAHAMAVNIYRENKDRKHMDEIKSMVKDALRAVRFNKGRGYYFAAEMTGMEQVFADRPEIEDRNLMGTRDADGVLVIQEMINLIKDQGEGYYRYKWTKPGRTENNFPKIAYIKHFKPFDWFIGTGEYPEDVLEEVKAEVLAHVEELKTGTSRYVFVGQYGGLPLTEPQKGENMYDVKNVNGLASVQELIAAAKAGGGFVNYALPGVSGRRISEKMSYVEGIDDWQWYVGSGFLIKDVNLGIAQKGMLLRKNIASQIFNSIFILAGMLLFIVFLEKVATQRIKKSIKMFSLFFDKAATESTKIETEAVHYSEFRAMANSVNEMIDRRKQTEDALKKSETALSSIFDAAPIGIGLVSDQVIKKVNDNWCRMLGYSTAELSEKKSDILFSDPDEFARIEKETSDQIRKRGAGSIETKWKCKDGSLIDVLLSYAVVDPKDHLVVAYTALDISDRKAVEKDRRRLATMLQQAQKMEAIGTLAGGIAHDFNNILSPILIQTEMALMDLPNDSLVRPNLEDVLEAGNRARELVKRILAFSSQSDDERSPIKVSSVVKESLKLLRATLPTTIEINRDFKTESDLVMADVTQIHQVVMNLFTNAYQALPEKGGSLSVVLDRLELDNSAVLAIPDLTPGTYLRLMVSDNGIGMDRSVQDRIFEPYFTTKDDSGGTGMGLAVTHGIVKSHEGAITVRSEPGKGTIFEVYLPCIESRGSLERGGSKPLPKGDEKILLVDDEEPIIDAIQKMLHHLGYQVHAMTSSVDALETFREQPHGFDLVITDQTMPGMTGEAFATEMMALRSDIPIILCTGFSHFVNEERAKAKGIRKFIMKPVVTSELAIMIREVLDNT